MDVLGGHISYAHTPPNERNTLSLHTIYIQINSNNLPCQICNDNRSYRNVCNILFVSYRPFSQKGRSTVDWTRWRHKALLRGAPHCIRQTKNKTQGIVVQIVQSNKGVQIWRTFVFSICFRSLPVRYSTLRLFTLSL